MNEIGCLAIMSGSSRTESNDETTADVPIEQSPDPMETQEASRDSDIESSAVGNNPEGDRINEIEECLGLTIKSIQPAEDGYENEDSDQPPVE